MMKKIAKFVLKAISVVSLVVLSMCGYIMTSIFIIVSYFFGGYKERIKEGLCDFSKVAIWSIKESIHNIVM